MYFFGRMHALRLDLEATPLDPDGYDGAMRLRSECGNDDVGSGCRILRLDLDIEGRLRTDDYFGNEFDKGLLFLILEEPVQHLHSDY